MVDLYRLHTVIEGGDEVIGPAMDRLLNKLDLQDIAFTGHDKQGRRVVRAVIKPLEPLDSDYFVRRDNE